MSKEIKQYVKRAWSIGHGQPLEKGVTIMGGKTDVVKGKTKEAVGVLTGNDRLRAEGQADQAGGKVKQAATKMVNKVKKALKLGRE